MDTYTLMLLTQKNLQSSLIQQQLSTIKNVSVESCAPEQLVELSVKRKVDLVVVDYAYLDDMLREDALPDFELLGFGLLVHNVPEEAQNFTFVRWKFLRGLLLQSASVDHLTQSVKYILSGGLWLPRKCLERTVLHYRDPDTVQHDYYANLTCREKQILDLIYHGKSNQQIASQLYLAESTVKSHIYKLYKKLHVHKRKEAAQVVRAVQNATGL